LDSERAELIGSPVLYFLHSQPDVAGMNILDLAIARDIKEEAFDNQNEIHLKHVANLSTYVDY